MEQRHQQPRAAQQASAAEGFSMPAEHLERVIARANLLQHAAGNEQTRQLSEEEILSIGHEVGLEPEHVRRAMAEYRAELQATPPDEDLLVSGLFGAGHARVHRIMQGRAEDIHRALERYLRGEERLRAVRLRGTSSLWEPDSGWLSKITRALDLSGKGFELSQFKSLEIRVEQLSSSEVRVSLTADMRDKRSEYLWGWGSGLALPLLLASGWIGFRGIGGLGLFTALVLAAGAGLAITAFATRRGMLSRQHRASLLLEGLLDRVEQQRR